jgi:hypothetical protein
MSEAQDSLIALADAVAAALNAAPAGTFALDFSARRYTEVPVFELGKGELDGLQVSVVPHGEEMERFSRCEVSLKLSVDIAIQQKWTGERAQLDALVLLSKRMGLYLAGHGLELPEVSFISWAREEPYDRDHLLEKRVFTGVMTVTYLTTESIRDES